MTTMPQGFIVLSLLPAWTPFPPSYCTCRPFVGPSTHRCALLSTARHPCAGSIGGDMAGGREEGREGAGWLVGGKGRTSLLLGGRRSSLSPTRARLAGRLLLAKPQ